MAKRRRVPKKRKYKTALWLMNSVHRKNKVAKIRRRLEKMAKEYRKLELEEHAAWNVAEKSKEVGYNPEIDTNWNHLPLELRMKCIDGMNLKTRIHLAATSKTEKMLVESKKCRLNYVTIYCSKGTFNVMASHKEEYNAILYKMEALSDTKLQCAKYLFQKCEVEQFEFSGYENRDEMRLTIADLEKIAPFRCQRFAIYSNDQDTVRFMLDNCPRLETIIFHEQSLFDSLALFGPVVDINEVCLTYAADLTEILKLLRKWIEIDAEVGKSFKFGTSGLGIGPSAIEDLASMFADSVLHSSKEEVIIRTNNEDKRIHILRHSHKELSNEYILTKVISSRAPNLGNRCDEWIEQRLEHDLITNQSSRCVIS